MSLLQPEFGDENSRVLIPSGLRVYRCFRVRFDTFNRQSASLRSMTIASYEWTPGVNEASCNMVKLTSFDSKDPNFCESCVEVDSRYKRLMIPNFTFNDPRLADVARNGDGWTTEQVKCWCSLGSTKYWPGVLSSIPSSPGYRTEDSRRNQIKFEVSFQVKLAHDNTPTPATRCECGFYGAYTLRDLRRSPGCHPGATTVAGVVEVTGRTVVGERGVRSQRMRILALSKYIPMAYIDSMHDDAMLRQLAERFDVPLFPSLEELQEAFPPDDIKGVLS